MVAVMPLVGATPEPQNPLDDWLLLRCQLFYHGLNLEAPYEVAPWAVVRRCSNRSPGKPAQSSTVSAGEDSEQVPRAEDSWGMPAPQQAKANSSTQTVAFALCS